MCSKGKQIKSILKPTSPKFNEQFKQTKEVVIEPLIGVSMVIPLNIGDITRFNHLTQPREINECVALISVTVRKRVLLMKQIHLMTGHYKHYKHSFLPLY